MVADFRNADGVVAFVGLGCEVIQAPSAVIFTTGSGSTFVGSKAAPTIKVV